MSGNSYFPQDEFIDRLKQDFPQVFTEGKVDPAKIQANLKGIVDLGERYGLSWKGKGSVYSIIQSTITKTLHPVREESVNFDETENLFIEGDNLDALKILQRSYYGKIKMIYIDPPYNTGNDFVYNDSFAQSKEEYDKESGKRSEDGYIISQTALQKNTKDSGHYHSNWLNMMYPRLYLARNLLRDDGVIFVSIDDNEVHNLRLIMNEIFGEDNFVTAIVRNTGTTTGQGNDIVGKSFDYLIAYSKTSDFYPGEEKLSDKDLSRYQLEDEGGKFSILQLRRTGNSDRREDRPSMYYSIKSPDNTEVYPIGPSGYKSRWRVGEKTYERMVKDKLIYWKKNNDKWVAYYKIYLKDRGKRFSNFWDNLEGNKKGSITVRELLGERVFDTPKPLELIKRTVQLSKINSKDTVLDFFAGSGTTAHAVMDLNAEDGGNRKWICVQLDEKTDEDSEAFKAGYKTIADIAKERIRRAGKKIGKGDVGFRVLKVGETNLKAWDSSIKDPERLEQQMEFMQDIVKEGVSEEDLLLELIIKSGIEPTVKREKVGDYWKVDEHLIICLAKEMTETIWSSILKEKPNKLIFLDSSLKGNDQLKTNLILKAEKEKIEVLVV